MTEIQELKTEVRELKDLILGLSKRVEEESKKTEDLRRVVIGISKSMSDSFKIIDLNFEGLAKRMDVVEQKIDSLTDHAEAQFGSVGEKLDELKVEVIKIQKVSGYSEQYENLLSISR